MAAAIKKTMFDDMVPGQMDLFQICKGNPEYSFSRCIGMRVELFNEKGLTVLSGRIVSFDEEETVIESEHGTRYVGFADNTRRAAGPSPGRKK